MKFENAAPADTKRRAKKNFNNVAPAWQPEEIAVPERSYASNERYGGRRSTGKPSNFSKTRGKRQEYAPLETEAQYHGQETRRKSSGRTRRVAVPNRSGRR
ncbi:hypothetical protein [Dictyobacter kobayashii]|uniref:Uncharacterized protein n=1 Tax=Dictyobacter kobayashii TaxID=2014872 RepID=A0A402AX68_9CHLR|nr:hypothetical protein [Dictyobacter kobayashii]GCE23696.1 hypothetical protein KDK_74960 [Dictyobacter kobayashii]